MTDKEFIGYLNGLGYKGQVICRIGICTVKPYETIPETEIIEVTVADIIDLINRQQTEIDNYSHNIKQLTEECRVMKETLTGGNGIRIRVDDMIVYADDLEEWLEFCDKQKTEAIKKFAEKVKENKFNLFNYIYSQRGFNEQIDNLSCNFLQKKMNIKGE